MQEGEIGYPVSVLVGHTGPVTFVDFSNVHASALLSSAYDGTCRIWDATDPSLAPIVLPASTSFGLSRGTNRYGLVLAMSAYGRAFVVHQLTFKQLFGHFKGFQKTCCGQASYELPIGMRISGPVGHCSY